MRNIPQLLCGLLVLAGVATAQSVQLSAPGNGATVSSPVQFVAQGLNGVAPLRLYVDNQSEYQSASAQLDASVALSNGRHHVVVVGWDRAGNSYTSSEFITVGQVVPVSQVNQVSQGEIAIASPTSGTVSSPVRFAATANPPSGRSIAALWIYIDNQIAYQGSAASLNTSLNVGSGSHYIVFQAWDNYGTVYKQAVTISVQNPSFQSDLTATAQWLRNTSDAPDGALLYGSSEIIPYYSNLAAIGLTYDPASYATVQGWMQWYIGHLNWPDRWGLYGTVYDYDYSNGVEISHNDADSTDSYAATFLTLALAYYQTGDPAAQSYVKSLAYQLDVIGGVVVQTQQSDGLTWAKPDYQIKYLMDNCEAYRGIRDLAQLFQNAIGDTTKAAYYNQIADQILNGIQGMWMNGSWAIYKDGLGALAAPNMGTWYPDATSQVFPALEGVILPTDARSQQVYNNFNNAWPGWPTLSFNAQDPFPWVLVGDAAAVMGDRNRANAYILSIKNTYVSQGFPWPFYNAEAGWFMRLEAYMMGARPL